MIKEIIPVLVGVIIGWTIASIAYAMSDKKLLRRIDELLKESLNLNGKTRAGLGKLKKSLENKQAQHNLKMKMELEHNMAELERKKKSIDDQALKDIIDTCR